MECIICSAPVAEERWELGYNYCMDRKCVSQALSHRKANMRIVLLPKQGYTYAFEGSKDLKGNGKSSGR